MSRRPPKAKSPKRAIEEKARRNKHISLPGEAFDALRLAVTGGQNSPVQAILNDLKPGESAVTSLSPMSFNKYRAKYKLSVKVGWFMVPGDEMANIRSCVITRLA